MQEIEIEFKNLLTRDQYEQLKVKWFNNQEPKKQTNYYFETDDFQLKKQQSALRVRKKTNQYVATLKQPSEEGLLETHDALTQSEAEKWFQNDIRLTKDIKQQLSHSGIELNQIKYKGELTTYRLEKSVNDFIVVLDYSHFNGKTDYELEVEAPSFQEGQAFFEQLLKDYHIKKQPTQNKIERFFNTLN